MGCRGSKSTIKAVNTDAQVNKLASSTLPPEILRTSAGVGSFSARKSPNRQLDHDPTEETQRGYSQNPSLANTKVEVLSSEQANVDEFFPVKVSSFKDSVKTSGFKEDFGQETGKELSELTQEPYRRETNEAPKEEEPMPGVLYDQPATNPFELLKTQPQGRVRVEEVPASGSEGLSPISGPRLAFGGDFTGLTADKISVA